MKLGLKHKQAILLLIGGANKKNTAKILGIRPETLSSWLKDSNFKKTYKRVMRDKMKVLHSEVERRLMILPLIIDNILTKGTNSEKLKVYALLLKQWEMGFKAGLDERKNKPDEN